MLLAAGPHCFIASTYDGMQNSRELLLNFV